MQRGSLKIGTRIAITASITALLVGLFAVTFTGIFFSQSTRNATFEITESAAKTLKSSIGTELALFEDKVSLCYGDYDLWWGYAQSSEHQFAASSNNWNSGECPLANTMLKNRNGIYVHKEKLYLFYSKKIDNGAILLLGKDLSDPDFLADVSEQASSEVAFFMGDTLYASTLKGEEAEGLTISEENMEKLANGETVIFRDNIGDEPYFMCYMPMFDANEELVGAYFAAYSAADYNSRLKSSMLTTFFAVLAACGAAALFFNLYARKNVTKPINALIPICTDIKDCNINADIKEFKYNKDEIGELAAELTDAKYLFSMYITDITNILARFADCDFTAKSEHIYRGDFAKIQASFRLIRANLGKTLNTITESADQVSQGAEQIATGTHNLSEGTVRQASAADELSATISSISENVTKAAQSAGSAAEISNKCANIMREQEVQMNEMLAAMDTIERESKDIAKVIKAIEDIAFQTNILSLNASVEAARAGEAGKGFGVVANEVGELANKSAQSAASSRDIIDSTLKSVKVGIELARSTAAALKETIGLSENSAQLVSDIAKDSAIQAQELKQATNGVADITHIIQQNSATAEESAASCQQLSSQARTLLDRVSVFDCMDVK